MFKGGELLEQHFTCPYCWEEISVLLDGSVPRQDYVEDCEVCCNPMLIRCFFVDSELVEFSAEVLGQ